MAWADPEDTHNPSTGVAIPASWGDAVNAAIQWLAGDSTNPKPSCRVYNTTDLSIATGTPTAATFNSERWDNGGMHSTASNTSRITIPSGGGGIYQVSGHIVWAANATGVRSLQLRVNGTTTIAVTDANSVSANTLSMSVSTLYALAAADYVELIVYQTSGGNLNVTAVSNYSPEFTAMWVAL